MAIRPFLLELQLCVIIFLRVAEQAEVNNMPASNLAIGEISSQLSLLFDFRIQNMLVHENLLSLILVFGPTLLKTTAGSASLSSLVDTVHQTRVVELLTRFTPDDPSQNAHYSLLSLSPRHATAVFGPPIIPGEGHQGGRGSRQRPSERHSGSDAVPADIRIGSIHLDILGC